LDNASCHPSVWVGLAFPLGMTGDWSALSFVTCQR
jgi:hypothetical protein